MSRLNVRKTYKLYIGGAFPRTESGRALTSTTPDGGFVAHYSRASRKDLRNAVAAARKAQTSWATRAAFNRGQILYRMAEMMESRRAVFIERLQEDAGIAAGDADTAVSRAIDTFVEYAGWADKFPQVFGAINPVSAPFFNFTTPSPIGVVVAVPANDLVSICDAVAATIVSGNAVVLVVEAPVALAAIELAEVFATSDLPGGVVNVLTGLRDELLPHIGSHRDIDAVLAAELSGDEQRDLEAAAADVVKRVHVQPAGMSGDGGRLSSPYRILPFVEFQTAWHPIGR